MTQVTGRTAAPPATTSRLLYLHNLRTALTARVVVHHSALGFSSIPGWFYTEPPTDPSGTLLDVMIVLNQTFGMATFFLIAGLLVPRSYDRKGAGSFLRDRLLRLGVPLLIWLLALRPLVTVGQYDEARDAAARQGMELPYWRYYLTSFEQGPLWFVEVLLLFSALYVLWRRLAVRGRHASASATGRSPGAVAIITFTLGLAVLTYVWRIAVPIGDSILGLPTPAYLPQYAAMFIVGLVAARRGWLGDLPRTAGRAGFATAAVAAVGLLLILLSAREAILGHGTLSSLIAAICESALAVGIILGLLVLFRERLNRQGPRRRWLSTHAYTVYVTHPVVLVALGHALSGIEAPAVAKAALLSVLAVPLCWATAYLVRALPGARKVL